MKSKFNLFASIFQIVIGIAAIIAFTVMTVDSMFEKNGYLHWLLQYGL